MMFASVRYANCSANDVGLRPMMTASPNDVRFANDVCLTAHWSKHRIIATIGSNIIFAKQMHHIAAGDASFDKYMNLWYNIRKGACVALSLC